MGGGVPSGPFPNYDCKQKECGNGRTSHTCYSCLTHSYIILGSLYAWLEEELVQYCARHLNLYQLLRKLQFGRTPHSTVEYEQNWKKIF